MTSQVVVGERQLRKHKTQIFEVLTMQEQKLGSFVDVCLEWQRFLQELSTSIVNRIVFSAQYVYCPLVIPHTILAISLHLICIGKPKKKVNKDTFPEMAHRNCYPMASPGHVCPQIYYRFNNTIGEKSPICKLCYNTNNTVLK